MYIVVQAFEVVQYSRWFRINMIPILICIILYYNVFVYHIVYLLISLHLVLVTLMWF